MIWNGVVRIDDCPPDSQNWHLRKASPGGKLLLYDPDHLEDLNSHVEIYFFVRFLLRF